MMQMTYSAFIKPVEDYKIKISSIESPIVIIEALWKIVCTEYPSYFVGRSPLFPPTKNLDESELQGWYPAVTGWNEIYIEEIISLVKPFLEGYSININELEKLKKKHNIKLVGVLEQEKSPSKVVSMYVLLHQLMFGKKYKPMRPWMNEGEATKNIEKFSKRLFDIVSHKGILSPEDVRDEYHHCFHNQ